MISADTKTDVKVAGCFHLNSKITTKKSSLCKDVKISCNTTSQFALVHRPVQSQLNFSCNQLLRLHASISEKTKAIAKTGSRNRT